MHLAFLQVSLNDDVQKDAASTRVDRAFDPEVLLHLCGENLMLPRVVSAVQRSLGLARDVVRRPWIGGSDDGGTCLAGVADVHHLLLETVKHLSQETGELFIRRLVAESTFLAPPGQL